MFQSFILKFTSPLSRLVSVSTTKYLSILRYFLQIITDGFDSDISSLIDQSAAMSEMNTGTTLSGQSLTF